MKPRALITGVTGQDGWYLRELLDHAETNVNVRAYGSSPLHFAARFDRRAAVTLLLGRPECDIDARDNNGETAWDRAVRRNHHVCADLIRCERERRQRVTDRVRHMASTYSLA